MARAPEHASQILGERAPRGEPGVREPGTWRRSVQRVGGGSLWSATSAIFTCLPELSVAIKSIGDKPDFVPMNQFLPQLEETPALVLMEDLA